MVCASECFREVYARGPTLVSTKLRALLKCTRRPCSSDSRVPVVGNAPVSLYPLYQERERKTYGPGVMLQWRHVEGLTLSDKLTASYGTPRVRSALPDVYERLLSLYCYLHIDFPPFLLRIPCSLSLSQRSWHTSQQKCVRHKTRRLYTTK